MKPRPEHWAIFDNYFTQMLGGLRIKRLGFWLEGSPKAEECEFCIELEDGTFIFTDHYYDEMWIEVHRPNGTVFTCTADSLNGKTKTGLKLHIDRYDTFSPEEVYPHEE